MEKNVTVRFIGKTEITVDAVQLDLIINALGCLTHDRITHRFDQPILSEHEYLTDLRRIHQLSERMKDIQDRCETPIF